MNERFLYRQLATRQLGQSRDFSFLAEELDRIREAALRIWQEQQHRVLTVHGKEHIAQVEENLDHLSRPLFEAGRGLSQVEIYVLLAACYLHDIGMQLGVPDAREAHAQYSFDLILRSFGDRFRELYVRLSIPDTNAREAIAEVARGHWTDFALSLPERDYIYGTQEGRLRLLGALLAMADLLDHSPVRARYFRSENRLHTLPATSELHQIAHHLTKGFRIEPAAPQVPGDLRFTIDWRDDSGDTRAISEWVLHRFTSEWRKLEPILHQDSAGTIRWAAPWAKAVFRRSLGDPFQLSLAARDILVAERSEQQRINRGEFCQTFLRALEQKQRVLFLLPLTPEGDGAQISEWCTAQARRFEGVQVARLDVRTADAPDQLGLLAALIEQWGSHLWEHSEPAAFRRLQEILTADGAGGFATVIVAEEYRPALLDKCLTALFERPSGGSGAARVCVLFSPGALGRDHFDGVEIHRPAWPEIPESDVEGHLRQNWGYHEGEAKRLAAVASSLSLRRSPGLLYTYVENEARVW